MSDDAMLKARMLIAEAIERPLSDVPNDASIATLPAWDSLAHVRLMLAIEAALEAPLQTDQMLSIDSANKIANLLNANRETR